MVKYRKNIMIKLKNTATLIFVLFTPLLASAKWDPSGLQSSGLPSGYIYDIIHNIMYWLLGVFAAIAIIGFAISGIMYIISSGNDDTMKKAKQAMIYSIIGVIVALSGLVIIYAVDAALNASSTF
jgi:hypothetical protein